MNRTDEPKKQPVPFGINGQREAIIPDTPSGDNSASYEKGFPPITMVLKAAGGLPPKGQDMNQILYELSNLLRWFSAGALNTFDADFNEGIGGYPKGAVILGNDAETIFINRLNGNKSNPNTTPTNWFNLSTGYLKTASNLSEIATAGPASVAAAVANLGLTETAAAAADALKKSANLSDLNSKSIARTNLGLGDAAQKTVTTSPQDITLGRVMQVGDGGLLSSGGVKLGNGVDLNTIIINGLYSCVAPVNGVAGAGITVLTVETYNQDWILQKLYVFDTGRLFYRARASTVWSTWSEIFSSKSPPTPAQVGALPITGGVISGGIQVASVNVTGD
ncbi:pyocin knob domain-containing protein, partial [Yersinia nurmii]|uniref:pyocin knob domain-containing protein n=1 Tax=Yersinia nurmii TaxID=685706 RepID=UPI00069FA255